jgi:hypothetical protein
MVCLFVDLVLTKPFQPLPSRGDFWGPKTHFTYANGFDK